MKYLFIILISLCQSILHSQEKEKTDSISYYNKLVNYNININDFDRAIMHIKKSIDYCETYKKKNDLVNQTLKLGKIYCAQKNYPAALQSFHKIIYLTSKDKPSETTALAYFYIGIANIRNEKYPIALNYFSKSDSIFKLINFKDVSNNLLLKKANAFETKKQFDLAITTYKQIIATKTDTTSLSAKIEAYYHLGDLLKKHLKEDEIALAYLKNALTLNKQTNNLTQKSNIIHAISKHYRDSKNFDKAYNYLEEYYQLKNHEIKNVKSGLSAYKNYKETQLLNIEKLKQKADLDRKNALKYSRLISILAIALISILSLLSLSLYKNNIIRHQNNLVLKEKNSELIIAKNKAEKASKARSEFLSTVSHELRTPLNAINGITHILIEENPKPSQLKYLESLKFSGNYLTTFINEILEINKIDSNKLDINNVNFNLKELLTNIQTSLKSLAIANNNKFIFKIDPDIPDHLIGDSTKLSQIVLNLINNALKFTQDGIVKVIINLQEIYNNRAIIYFEVTDTGIGIPEDKLQTVFESFSQGSIGVNRKYGGTGLGLTIVKKLIQMLGSEIKLKSEPEKGSTFSFDLEFGIDKEPFIISETEQLYKNENLENKKILLVEDNKINQMITKKMLANKKMNCNIVESGEEAIKIIRNNKFDLVLMDVHLPGINGTTATQLIREFDQTTPIIALTAISLHENRGFLLSYGMNEVITKPFIPDDFYACIAKFL